MTDAMKTEDGKLFVISGASRCGKTDYTRRQVEAALPTVGGRVMAWDPEDQWSKLPGWRRVTTKKELKAYATVHRGPMRIAYVVGGDLPEMFDYWCGCIQYAARYVAPLAAIAEELADVTSAAKAPGNWGILLRRGLKRGTLIWAISQRWQEADKTALGNSTEFVIFRQNTADDAKYMARKTRVPQELIDGLQKGHYIRYITETFERSRDRLPWSDPLPTVTELPPTAPAVSQKPQKPKKIPRPPPRKTREKAANCGL